MSETLVSIPMSGLMRWKSKKIVSAGEITEVVLNGGCHVRQSDATSIIMLFTPDMTVRYSPVPGDFWVIYDDGYQAISPRAPFLAGYDPIVGG